MKAILKVNWGQHKVGDAVDLNPVQYEFAMRKGIAQPAVEQKLDIVEKKTKVMDDAKHNKKR